MATSNFAVAVFHIWAKPTAVVLVGGGTRIAVPSAQVRLNLTLTRQGRLDVAERALWAATSHHNVLAVPLTGQQLSPLPPTAAGG